MISYKAIIAYDGSPFFGWQKTAMGPSVQESLEKSLFQLAQEKVIPEAASRTDRGVHAEGQVIAFSLQDPWEAAKLQRGMNAVLPPEIRVIHMEERKDEFHPTLHAKGKEYHYRLCCGEVQDPIHRFYSWHFRNRLDLEAMKKASRDLLGQNDLSAFANESEENPICTLNRIDLSPLPDNRLQISMTGDRFLYKMARTIAGTLTYIGCGKLNADCIPALIRSKRRETAGVTAPAHGLFLHRVFYA